MKKMFKKAVAVVLTVAMALTVGTPVFAAEEVDTAVLELEQTDITLLPGEEYIEELENGITLVHSLEVIDSVLSPYATLKAGEAHYYIRVYQNAMGKNFLVAQANLNVWYSYGDNRVFITDVSPILTRYSDIPGTLVDFNTDSTIKGNGAKTAIVTGNYYMKREYPDGTFRVATPEVTINFTCEGNTISVMSDAMKA